LSAGEPDPRRRFSPTALDYERARPGYPEALIGWVTAECRPRTGAPAADVGCGTGISTRALAGRGLDVVGIDPNPEMLARARAAGGARYRRGEADATGLPTSSQRLVTAAQALHWFGPRALDEFGRILEPGGWCAAWWNVRLTDGPFGAAYEALLLEHCSGYSRVPRAEAAIAALRGDPRVVNLCEAVFGHDQELDRESWLARVRSSSYVAHGLVRPEEFQKGIEGLFEGFSRSGRLQILYTSLALRWQLRLEGTR